MNWKPIIFFITICAALLYLIFFWENKKSEININIGQQKRKINLGLLLIGIFFDGAVIGSLIFWLLN